MGLQRRHGRKRFGCLEITYTDVFSDPDMRKVAA
jgi:hypothetical protein